MLILNLFMGVLCSAPAFGAMGALRGLNSGTDGLKFPLLTALLFISASANGTKQTETYLTPSWLDC